jgi:hypothetical protein
MVRILRLHAFYVTKPWFSIGQKSVFNGDEILSRGAHALKLGDEYRLALLSNPLPALLWFLLKK